MNKILIALLILYFSNIVLAGYFGAIAYSPSYEYVGYSYDYSNQEEAENAALNECGYYDCQALVWFENGCGALAVGYNGYGSGWGETQALAESYALDTCYNYTDGCEIVRWVCTTRY